MNLLDKITLAVINAPMVIRAPLSAGTDQDIQKLVGQISAIISAVVGALGGLAGLILGYRLIRDIILSKKEDNPEEEVAKYKKRISNTLVALIIVVVVIAVLETGAFTFIQTWITEMLQK